MFVLLIRLFVFVLFVETEIYNQLFLFVDYFIDRSFVLLIDFFEVYSFFFQEGRGLSVRSLTLILLTARIVLGSRSHGPTVRKTSTDVATPARWS